MPHVMDSRVMLDCCVNGPCQFDIEQKLNKLITDISAHELWFLRFMVTFCSVN